MKQKLLNFLVILTSLLGYLEWANNKMFLFQGEWEVLTRLATDPVSVAHPFTLLPLLGQVLLIITLFQKQPAKWLTIIGVASIGVLLLFMFLVGVIDLNLKIAGATLPFILVSAIAIRNVRRHKE